MNEWQIWLETGIRHILDLNGYDHMMFISLLVFSYPVSEWKKLFGLITAFTVGHSLTLALSVMDFIKIRQQYTELLIILTIIITSIYTLFRPKNPAKGVIVLYTIICCFGLIHGLGFSYLLKAMLSSSDSVLFPLLMFNIGLEVGQIVIVGLVVVILLLIGKYAKTIEWYFKVSVIVLILVTSFFLCYTRILTLIYE